MHAVVKRFDVLGRWCYTSGSVFVTSCRRHRCSPRSLAASRRVKFRCTPRPRAKGQKRGETGCVGGLSNSTQYKLAYRCFHFFTCAFLFHEISRNFCFTHDSLSLPLRNAYRWITSSSGFPANRFNLKRYQETAR